MSTNTPARRQSNADDSDSIDIDSIDDCKPALKIASPSLANSVNNNNKLKFSISSLLDSAPPKNAAKTKDETKEELHSDDDMEDDVEDDMKSFSDRSGSPYSVISGKGSEGMPDPKMGSMGSVIHSAYPHGVGDLSAGGPAIYPANLAYPWLPAAAAAAAATPFLKDGLPSSKFCLLFCMHDFNSFPD